MTFSSRRTGAGSGCWTPSRRCGRSTGNPPRVAVIAYYRKPPPSAAAALEILDASGAVVRRFSSDDRPAPRDPNTLAVQLVWAPQTEPLPATAGMHRWV